MAGEEFFVRKGTSVAGPFSKEQMKQMAITHLLSPDDEVARAANGPWYKARAYKNLIPPSRVAGAPPGTPTADVRRGITQGTAGNSPSMNIVFHGVEESLPLHATPQPALRSPQLAVQPKPAAAAAKPQSIERASNKVPTDSAPGPELLVELNLVSFLWTIAFVGWAALLIFYVPANWSWAATIGRIVLGVLIALGVCSVYFEWCSKDGDIGLGAGVVGLIFTVTCFGFAAFGHKDSWLVRRPATVASTDPSTGRWIFFNRDPTDAFKDFIEAAERKVRERGAGAPDFEVTSITFDVQKTNSTLTPLLAQVVVTAVKPTTAAKPVPGDRNDRTLDRLLKLSHDYGDRKYTFEYAYRDKKWQLTKIVSDSESGSSEVRQELSGGPPAAIKEYFTPDL